MSNRGAATLSVHWEARMRWRGRWTSKSGAVPRCSVEVSSSKSRAQTSRIAYSRFRLETDPLQAPKLAVPQRADARRVRQLRPHLHLLASESLQRLSRIAR